MSSRIACGARAWLWMVCATALFASWESRLLADTGGPTHVPYVGLREERGHLTLVTCLPAGRGDFSAIDEQGLSLHGFVQVTEDETLGKRVRLFRLTGRKAVVPDGAGPAAQPMWVGFSASLSATPSPGHYTLRFKSVTIVDGELHEEEAVLGRTCCGYHLRVTATGQEPLPIGRGKLLTDLMVESADAYRRFEQLAAKCCRPAFELVPTSHLSPALVAQVVDRELMKPTAKQSAEFQHMLADLDSDQLAVREAASDTLLAGGQSTLLWLDGVKLDPLSAEQRYRLKQARSELERRAVPLPFSLPDAELETLTASPPAAWLSQLRNCSDLKVRDWARNKLSESVAAIPITESQDESKTEH